MEESMNQGTELVVYEQESIEEDYELNLSNLSDVDVRSCFTGLRAKTILEFRELFRKQSNALGFAIRSSTTRGPKDGPVIEKYYVCACEGFAKDKKESPVTPIANTIIVSPTAKKKRRPKKNLVTRTGCKAAIRIKFVKGAFEVMHHFTNHNHELTRTKWQYMQRSEREITEEKGMMIDGLEEAGVKPSVGFKLMVHEAGGREIVGHSYKDHMNRVNRLRMKLVEGGDANKVCERLKKKESEDKEFYFKVRTDDDDDRLLALFWRDSMMKEDYQLYGDFIVFDTTYRTNKYNLICAPIVGMNNHGSIVMFACAFIADEKAETFEWLLSTFIKSMGYKEPTTIFTDQDPAMGKAIRKILPNTKHRLCLWHINQNAISHFGELKKDGPFKDAFNHCLKFCKNEAEFEEKWNDMIKTYKLEDKDWFHDLYDKRHKWCPALNKDFFSAGTLSSQRSESTNNALSFNANKNTSLNRFLTIFDDRIEEWRANEMFKERQCAASFPKSAVNGPKILQHAARVYTLSVYYKFEKEYKLAQATKAVQIFSLGETMKFEVSPEKDETNVDIVEFARRDDSLTVKCSCKTFEETGILCFHCIRILHINSVSEIPKNYICKRWTKMAKKEVWDKLEEAETREGMNRSYIPWRHQMARNCYNLVLRSEGDSETRKIFEETLDKVSHRISEIIASKEGEAATSSEGASSVTNLPKVNDPSPTKTKGRSKRIGRWNKSSSAKKSKENEFGTKTPVQEKN